MTPALLLERGGFHLSRKHAVTYPHVSDDFGIGLEGTSMPRGLRFKGTLMGLGAQVEITTKPKRPVEAFSLIEPLGSYLESLGDNVGSRLLPGSDSITYHGGWLRKKLNPGIWQYCPMHWTVGLELSHVPKLLEWTNHPVHSKVEEVCRDRSPEYQAVVALGAMVLQQAHDCLIRCTKPKICMRPWLVRTHFGDMVKRVRKIEGEEQAQNLPEDVLRVSGHGRDLPLFNGFRDYTTFLEMAQLGGMVQTPSFGESNEVGSNGDLELGSEQELLDLAQQMLTSKADVHRRLSGRPCTVHGPDAEAFEGLTAGAWLDAMLEGRDVMSDSDSPISKTGSFSHLVFKSMGAWRMRNGETRIYLECRRPRHCIPQHPARDRSILAEMRYVASSLDSFEHALQSGIADSFVNATSYGGTKEDSHIDSSTRPRRSSVNTSEADSRGASAKARKTGKFIAKNANASYSAAEEDSRTRGGGQEGASTGLAAHHQGTRAAHHLASSHRDSERHGSGGYRRPHQQFQRLSSQVRKHALAKRAEAE